MTQILLTAPVVVQVCTVTYNSCSSNDWKIVFHNEFDQNQATIIYGAGYAQQSHALKSKWPWLRRWTYLVESLAQAKSESQQLGYWES